MQAGPFYLLSSTFGRGRAPLMRYTCRAVFPSCHTLAGRCSPSCPHTCRAVFPSCHTCERPCSPLAHTLAGPCYPHATHLRGHVPLCHTHWQDCVPPLCYTLAGPCSPYAECSQERSPICHSLTGPCFPYATRSQARVSSYTTQSQGQAAQLPEQGEAFIYSPLLVPVRGSGFHSAWLLTDLKGGVLMG